MKPITDGYRADIDGLRAFAVLFVTIFHINEALIPGGFIGVDIFFVISGYLITGIIVRERAAGRFSFAEFYRRRIRRIFPAMFLVTGVTLAVGLMLMLPSDVEALSWSALATMLSGANVFFTYFLDTSYFAADSATVPLLHMWSLGVEEQFYLFWPAMLLLLLRWPRVVLPALLLIIVASIALGEWLLRRDSLEWAYYMLPPRAFQLALGGALVFVLPRIARMGPVLAALLAVVGAVLCGASAFLLGPDMPYPGLWAVPVTIGAAALIAAGSVPNVVSSALTFAPLRAIGLISYSLYLWHWPVLAFQRYLFVELSVTQQVVSFVVMLVLAWLSYRFVEQPARRSTRSLGQTALRMAAAPLGLLGAGVAVLLLTGGMGPWAMTTYPKQLSTVAAHSKEASSAKYVCQSGVLTEALMTKPDCVINGRESAEPKVLLWGDSNAGHYVGALRAIAEEAGFGFRNIAHSACAPILRKPERFASEKWAKRCQGSNRAIRRVLKKYDGFILSAAWDGPIGRGDQEFEKELTHTIATLIADGKAVVLLGRVPRMSGFDAACHQKQVKAPFLECREVARPMSEVNRINDVLRRVAETTGATYVDFQSVLCPGGTCSASMNGVSIYKDPGHLSRSGSERLGEVLRTHKDIIDRFAAFATL